MGGSDNFTFEFSDVRLVAWQMLQALDCMHKKRLVHGDIKPGNILTSTDDETMMLCDFGVAMKLGDGPTQLKASCGTYSYMSPELLTERKIDTSVRI